MTKKNPDCNLKQYLISLFLLYLLIWFFQMGCTKLKLNVEVLSTIEPITTVFPGGNKILINTENTSKFIANVLGSEFLRFRSRTDFYWFKTSANDVISDLNKHLLDANWQIQSDWGYQNGHILLMSTWMKGDYELSVLLFDDLDSVGIESLSKNYRISGPVPGSTMLVLHIIDKAAPLP